MMRRFGRTAFFFPLSASRTLSLWAGCLWTAACLAASGAQPVEAAQRVLGDPPGLRFTPEVERKVEPRVIPPSSAPKALEERHNIRERTQRYTVDVEYPSVGVPAVDQAVAVWCRQKMDTFVAGVADIPAEETTRFSLSMDYSLYQSSPHSASIVFLITTDTGGFQPIQAVAAFTYDLRTGRLLRLEDIFAAGSGLSSFLSFYSRKELAGRFSDSGYASPYQAGSDPLDYSCFALTTDGMALFFAPGRDAAEQVGVQRVDIPLTALAPYHPNADLWPPAGGRK